MASNPSLTNAKKILVVPLQFIGDSVVSIPLIRNLHAQLPQTAIDCMASQTTAPLLETCPYLNEVIREPGSVTELYKLLKNKRYDAVLILRMSFTFAAVARLAGIKTLIGFDKQRFFEPIGYRRWGLFLDRKVSYPSLRTETHQVENILQFLPALDLKILTKNLELWATEEDEKNVLLKLSEENIDLERPLAILHLASASHGKAIDPEKFIPAASELASQGYQVICTGIQKDSALFELLKSKVSFPLHNFAGKTTLRETFTLYKKASMMLTIDSGPMHLAAAAGIPKIVGIFGPTNENQWRPYSDNAVFKPVFIDLPCRPCYAKICEHNRCRTELNEDMILEATQDVIH